MSTSFGDGAEGRRSTAKVRTHAPSSEGCSFCAFVLTLYPDLTGMTTNDGTLYKQHLKNTHGLRDMILP
jgi:hypothetical protein